MRALCSAVSFCSRSAVASTSDVTATTMTNTCSTINEPAASLAPSVAALFVTRMTTPTAADSRMASNAPIWPKRSVAQMTGTMIM